jgi:hypothetical protein
VGRESDGSGGANSAADGGFRVGGLASQPYAIVVGSELAG